MEKGLGTQAAHVGQQEQYGIRKSIIRLVKKGMSNKEIAETLDVSERHFWATQKTYTEQGIAGIKPKKRGRRVG